MKLLQRILTGSVLCTGTVLGMVLLDFSDIALAGNELIELARDAAGEPAQDVAVDAVEERSPASVPEPGMLVLMGLGTLGMGIARRFSQQYAKRMDSSETPASM